MIVVLVGVVSAIWYVIRDDLNAAVAELPAAARKLRLAAADAARQPESPMTHVKAAAAELDRAAAEATGKRAPVVEPPSNNMAGQLQTFVAEQSAKALVVMAEVVMAILLTFFLLAAGDTFRAQGRPSCGGVAGAAPDHGRGIERDRRADPGVHGDAAGGERADRAEHVGGAGGAGAPECRDVGRIRRRAAFHPVRGDGDHRRRRGRRHVRAFGKFLRRRDGRRRW